MLLPLRGVATPGHGEGEGSAGDKFRVSGTQETVEGAGANEVSGVLSEASCCRCGAPLIKKGVGHGAGSFYCVSRDNYLLMTRAISQTLFE